MAGFWVSAGDQARVLVYGGRIELVVYWEDLVVDGIRAKGFYYFSAARPKDHGFLQEAHEITENGWHTACELASREHFEPLPPSNGEGGQ